MRARLVLRPVEPGDADALLRIWLDPPVLASLYAHRPPPTRERVEAWLARSVATPARVFMALQEDDIIGYAGIQPLPETGEPELFYGFHSAAWGQGFATEAGRIVLAHARDALGLARVVGVVLPTNVASARVLEKLGFERIGMTTHAGEPHVHYERAL